MTLRPFPEFDDVLKALLDDIAPVVNFESDQLEPPFVYVTRVGGPTTELFDNPVVDVECVDIDRAASKVLKTTVLERIRAAGNTAPGGYLIDNTSEPTGGQYLPPMRRDTRGVTATVRLSYRRSRA